MVDIGGKAMGRSLPPLGGLRRHEGAVTMRHVLLLSGLLRVGCQGVNGPFARKARPERIDDPRLSIAEQQQRGRDQLALPEQSPQLGPRTWMEPPGAGAYGR